MGSVWSATHLGLGQQVAIKLVSATFARSTEGLRRFDREAKAAAKIQSRHVPQVFDNGVLDDGTPFLAMELLRGESLAKRIQLSGPISLPETVSILDQCCRALSRAHSLGIVHRDIKPDNIYLARSVDEDGYVVKVLDFGIAKFTSLGEVDHSATRTGTLVGTPQFMSPEQARGLRSVDFRTDLYSLGLVAYTMLTGNVAFSGDSLGDLLLQICAEPLPLLRAAAPLLPSDMEAWFQRACARDPEQRYPSAQALAEALRIASGVSAHTGAGDIQATTGSPVSATNGAPFTGKVPTSKSNRWVWVVLAAATGLIAGAFAILALRGRPMRSPVVSAPSPATTGLPAATSSVPQPAPVVTLEPMAQTTATVPSATANLKSSSAPRPPATSASHPSRPLPSASPSTPTKNTNAHATKPTGNIDLGY
jgi:serine/threonine-protein kinase